jgi:hypothetical protein
MDLDGSRKIVGQTRPRYNPAMPEPVFRDAFQDDPAGNLMHWIRFAPRRPRHRRAGTPA